MLFRKLGKLLITDRRVVDHFVVTKWNLDELKSLELVIKVLEIKEVLGGTHIYVSIC